MKPHYSEIYRPQVCCLLYRGYVFKKIFPYILLNTFELIVCVCTRMRTGAGVHVCFNVKITLQILMTSGIDIMPQEASQNWCP
jgi:hypothetical protein